MTTQTPKQQIQPGTYAADPVHSSIGFAVIHNGVSTFRGSFSTYEARLVGGEEPWLEGSVDVASLDVPDEQLKGHLLSPEFFDADRHPQLRFGSTELDIDEDGSLRVRGELEIKGRRHEVGASGKFAQLGANLTGTARVGLSLETAVDRRDFGLDWNAELPSGGWVLEHGVSIAVELELVKEGG
jgi:polyisoprenoid-binding protein YceI